MSGETSDLVDMALAKADLLAHYGANLPTLLIDDGNLTATAREAARRLAARPNLFHRGGLVRVVTDPALGGSVVERLTRQGVALEIHAVCQPKQEKEKTRGGVQHIRRTIPDRVCDMVLSLSAQDSGVRHLDGISSAPVLADDGSVDHGEGYDPRTRIRREAAPALRIPERPSRADALAALRRVRHRFRTFCFADAVTTRDANCAVPVVDLAKPPGMDESSALAALLMAVCRPSMDLAPALLVAGAEVTGSGAGKGLLVRCICAVAFGRRPSARTTGDSAKELDKRLTAAFLNADEVVFLDNCNTTELRSDVLASVLTERPAKLRPLGRSEEWPVNSTAFVVVTGNAVTLSEDLARRFLLVRLDPRTDDPETRSFPGDILAEVTAARASLLADALTIWRWGRQNDAALPRGRPLGSYGQWARWCRDPLLALGCRDPTDRVAEIKAADPRRQANAELFQAWHAAFGFRPVTAAEVAMVPDIDSRLGGNRQAVAARLRALSDGTRAGGFAFNAIRPAGKWATMRYQLAPVSGEAEAAADDVDSLL